MKTFALLLAVFVAASVAKPSANKKELVNLLKKILNEKQEDIRDPVADSTILEGIPDLEAWWFDIFGFISEIPYLPVDADFMDAEKAAVQANMSAVLNIAEFMKEKLGEFKDSSAPKDKSDIADFIFDVIGPVLEENDVDLWLLSESAYVQIIIAAVRGTVAAEIPEDNEPGCDLEQPSYVAVPCAMNKMFMVQLASFITMTDAYEKLNERIEGRPFLRRCDQLDRLLSGPNKEGPPGADERQGPEGQGPTGSGPTGNGPTGSGPKGNGPTGSGPKGNGPTGRPGPDGEKLVEEFAASIACVKANIEATRDFFRGPEEAAEERRLPPVPTIIRRAALLEHVQGHIYFVGELLDRVLRAVAGPKAAEEQEVKRKERIEKSMQNGKHLRYFHAKAEAHKKHFYY